MKRSTNPLRSLLSTAYCVAGTRATIAYRVALQEQGPHGESKQVFLIETLDRGRTWKPVLLRRTLWSRLRFWGYPVWPPEEISGLTIVVKDLGMAFQDAEVPFEPGGESVWQGTRSLGGSWRVNRIREMNYRDGELGLDAPALSIHLPGSFSLPPEALVRGLAQTVALQRCPQEPTGLGIWLSLLPLGLVAANFGSSAQLLASIALYIVFWISASHYTHHRRMRDLCVQ